MIMMAVAVSGVGMSSVVVSEITACQGYNEYCQPDQHQNAFPSEMPCRTAVFMLMVYAVWMFRQIVIWLSLRLIYQVDSNAGYYRNHEQHCKQYECLLREHCQHD